MSRSMICIVLCTLLAAVNGYSTSPGTCTVSSIVNPMSRMSLGITTNPYTLRASKMTYVPGSSATISLLLSGPSYNGLLMYTDSSTSEVEAKRAGGLVTTEPGLTNQCTSQAQATVQSSVASGKHTIGHFNAPGAVVNMHTALPLNITLLLPSSGPVTVKTSVAQGDVRGVYWVLPPLTIYPTTMFCASISSNTGNCPAGMVKSADYTSKTCAQDPCASTDCCVTAVLQGGWVRTNKNCGVSSNNTLGVEYELECLAFGKDLKTVQRRKFLSHLKTCALGTFNYREYQGMAVSDYVASTTVNMTSYFRYRYDMKSILVFAASDKSVFDLNHPVSGCPCGRTWKLNEQRTIVFADCPVGSCPRALEDWAVPAYGSHFLNTTDATIARTFEYPTATSWTFSKLNAHYVKVVDVNHPCYAADAALGYDLDPFPMCPNSLCNGKCTFTNKVCTYTDHYVCDIAVDITQVSPLPTCVGAAAVLQAHSLLLSAFLVLVPLLFLS